MKILTIVFILIVSLNADNLLPNAVFSTKNNVISTTVSKNLLFVSTDGGSIEIFDIKTAHLLNTITLPKIKNGFSDELENPRIISTNSLDGKKILILSEDTKAGKAVHIYENGKLEQIFSHEDKLNISKIYFLDNDRVILGTLGNEIMLYELNKKTFLYSVQSYWSMLTDFTLDSKNSLVFSATEGGIIYIHNALSGKKIDEFAAHTDIALNISHSNGVIISGGADKKCFTILLKTGEKYSLDADFPIYATGVSPSGKTGAFILNERNDIALFDTQNRQIKTVLKTAIENKKINNIIFLSEDELIISSNGKEILKWRVE
ncbi:MAG: hypothetical protein LBS39_00685 [Campylobacteraceae bacterium]|nr:hypothetical protein [Campylobacteraceae bacterium]